MGYQALASSIVFLPGPPVLANTWPKAGTYLLLTLLQALPRLMYSGRHLQPSMVSRIAEGDVVGHDPPADPELVRRFLAAVRGGQYAHAHFPMDRALADELAKRGFRSLFLTRDPRDVALSQVFYTLKRQDFPLRRSFEVLAQSQDDRLMLSIRGFGPTDAGPGFASIRERISSYHGWLKDPNTLVVRFEDLIGAHGGGSQELQHRAIHDVARHVERPLEDESAARVAGRIWRKDTDTFRKGAIGDWSNHFSRAHKDAFKELAGDLLVDLGYEEDLDW